MLQLFVDEQATVRTLHARRNTVLSEKIRTLAFEELELLKVVMQFQIPILIQIISKLSNYL